MLQVRLSFALLPLLQWLLLFSLALGQLLRAQLLQMNVPALTCDPLLTLFFEVHLPVIIKYVDQSFFLV